MCKLGMIDAIPLNEVYKKSRPDQCVNTANTTVCNTLVCLYWSNTVSGA